MILIEKSRLNLIGAYGALGLAVFLRLQTTLLSGWRILQVTPVMTVAAVVCVAVFEGEVTGGLFGLFLGLALDATVSTNSGGAAALSLLLVGALSGFVCKTFMLPAASPAPLCSILPRMPPSSSETFCCALAMELTAQLSGFFRVAEVYTTTALVSLFYLPPLYYVARRMNLSFGGPRTTE